MKEKIKKTENKNKLILKIIICQVDNYLLEEPLKHVICNLILVNIHCCFQVLSYRYHVLASYNNSATAESSGCSSESLQVYSDSSCRSFYPHVYCSATHLLCMCSQKSIQKYDWLFASLIDCICHKQQVILRDMNANNLYILYPLK